MKVLGVLLTVIVIAAVLYGIYWIGRKAFTVWRNRHSPWEMAEDSDGEQVVVHAVRPGQEPLLIGAVPFAAMDFDNRVYELRAEGREKVYALNQRSDT